MTSKLYHEIRDPIHVFITVDSAERDVLDSRPVQRLRHIHQLAMGYLVYPGATHKRFEHALGVMELGSRVYDIITRPDLAHDRVRRTLPEMANEDQRRYWRRVLRMAALCHDIGHLPFSHAAEHELLPTGWTHETITKELVLSDEMRQLWQSVRPPLIPEDIVKLAVGPSKLAETTFSDWEAVLSEIVVGDAFGVDRMDYLLRDSLHAGVQYGKFDHDRLINTLRIVPESDEVDQPRLGVEGGGLHSAEALLLARYSMFSQVYLHPVRRAYDLHLKEFLREWLPQAHFPEEPQEFLKISDIEVLAGIRQKATEGLESASRIARRQHFKVAYERHTQDLQLNPEPGTAISRALINLYGEGNVRLDNYVPRGQDCEFPVLQSDGRIASSLAVSDILQYLPTAAIDFVFVEPSIRGQAQRYVADHLQEILAQPEGGTPHADQNGAVGDSC